MLLTKIVCVCAQIHSLGQNERNKGDSLQIWIKTQQQHTSICSKPSQYTVQSNTTESNAEKLKWVSFISCMISNVSARAHKHISTQIFKIYKYKYDICNLQRYFPCSFFFISFMFFENARMKKTKYTECHHIHILIHVHNTHSYVYTYICIR